MSSFDSIRKLLVRYHALEFHHNPPLARRLMQIQRWQKSRMLHTHAELFAQPRHQQLTAYFTAQLYGGVDFLLLARQCKLVLGLVEDHQALISPGALLTVQIALKATLLTIELDQQLAQLMTEELDSDALDSTANDVRMMTLYQRANQAQARHHQLDLLDHLGQALGEFIHSTIARHIFIGVRDAATEHGLSAGYAFLAEGFRALAVLPSVEALIQQFTAAERLVIDQIYGGEPNPFARAC